MRKINALWGALILTASAMAADMDSGTLGQLEVIQQQNILLTSQAETARLRKEIRDSESDGAGNGSSGADNLPAVSTPTANGLPTTDSIVGRNGTLMATLRLTNGARVDVKAGEKITGTPWTVARITLNGVWINNGHSVTGLAFSE
ncbi:type IV pilus biogenesis protein PilP [Enterobacter kobei]|uniref:type IV pilus biogenesis protein PilP n=1 Tax=Enterobacter kobei TaxID=208224 RepID=UPI003CEEEA3B